MRNVYQDALDVQSACNLSGVAHSLSRHLTENVWPEVRANNGGTDDVNRHPAVILFVAQLLYLSTGQMLDMDKYSEAYKVCREKAQH